MRQNLSIKKQKGRGEDACQLDQEEVAVGCKMAALGLCLAKLGEKSLGVQRKSLVLQKRKLKVLPGYDLLYSVFCNFTREACCLQMER